MSTNIKKERVVAYMQPEIIKRMDSLLEVNNFKNQSEFICKATDFYIGYLNSTNNSDYLNTILMSAIQATLKTTESRMANNLFRLTIEMAMMMNILAEGLEVSEDSLRVLRSRCIKEIKANKGRVDFEKIIMNNSSDM